MSKEVVCIGCRKIRTPYEMKKAEVAGYYRNGVLVCSYGCANPRATTATLPVTQVPATA